MSNFPLTDYNRLLVDQDGVLADFMGHVYKTVEAETGRKYCHADTQDYWFKDCPDKDLFMDIINRQGTYSDLDVITGAVEAIKRLREYYDVVVVTAPPRGSKTAEDEKRQWLARHFDKDFAEEAIVTRDKHLVHGRLMIEDNPDIDRDADWRPLMFDQPWNRKSDLPRMYGWGDLSVVYRNMMRLAGFETPEGYVP